MGPALQWRTQALVHEKIQCIKQLRLKGEAAQGYKLLLCPAVSRPLHVLLFLSLLPLSYSFSSVFSIRSLSPQRFLLGRANNITTFFNSLIWQFF